MELKDKLVKIIKDSYSIETVQTSGVATECTLNVEEIAEALIKNGVILLPCKVYNIKHKSYQIITKSKQGHLFSGKFIGPGWIKYEMKKRGIEE